MSTSPSIPRCGRSFPAVRFGFAHADGEAGFRRGAGAYIYGSTPSGDYGLPYQLAKLARYGLKATYFVEPFFSLKAGTERL